MTAHRARAGCSISVFGLLYFLLFLLSSDAAVITPPANVSPSCSIDGFGNTVVSEATRISAYLLGIEEFMTNAVSVLTSAEISGKLGKGPSPGELSALSFNNGTETTYFERDPNRLVEVVWNEWGDRAIDLECLYDLMVDNDFQPAFSLVLAGFTHGCVKEQPDRLTELCLLPPFNETCPTPSDAVSSPTTRTDYPNGGNCPSFCLDPMLFQNSFRQWFSDFSSTFSLLVKSFEKFYPNTLFAILSPSSIYFGHRPDMKRLNTTLTEVSVSVFGDKVPFSYPPTDSLAIHKANPERRTVWGKPHGSFIANGRIGSTIDTITPVYVDDYYIGALSAGIDSTETIRFLEGVVLPKDGFNFVVEIDTARIVAAPSESYDQIFCPNVFCDPETQTFNESRLDRSTEFTLLPSLFDANPWVRSLWNTTLYRLVNTQTTGIIRYMFNRNENDTTEADPTEFIVAWARIEFGSAEEWVLVHVVEAERIDEAAVWSLSSSLATVKEGTSGSVSFVVSNRGTDAVTWTTEYSSVLSGISVSPASGTLLSGEDRVITVEYTSLWSETSNGSGTLLRLVPDPLEGSSSCFEVLSFSLSVTDRSDASTSLTKAELLWATIAPTVLLLLTCLGGLVFFRIQTADADAKRSRALLEQEQDFVAFTFHELRTPLSGAAGFLEYALQGVGELVKADSAGKDPHIQYDDEETKLETDRGQLPSKTMTRDENVNEVSTLSSSKSDTMGFEVDGSAKQSKGRKDVTPSLLEQAHGDLIRAHHCYNHTLDILNHVLDMAKLARNELSLDAGPLDIQETCFMACVMQNVGNPHVGLSVLVDEDIPAVIGDSKRLKQVCLNLLSNALTCTHFGYVILQCEVVGRDVRLNLNHGNPVANCTTTTAGSCECSDVDGSGGVNVECRCGISVDYGSITLRFSVYDTGVGIPTNMQKVIFSQYECLDKKVGTGLGLSVCSKLVELMGGAIHVKSPCHLPEALVQCARPINEPSILHIRGHGPGSCFWFEVNLPLAEDTLMSPSKSDPNPTKANLMYSGDRTPSMDQPHIDSDILEEKSEKVDMPETKVDTYCDEDTSPSTPNSTSTLELLTRGSSYGKYAPTKASASQIELLALPEAALSDDFATITHKWQVLIVDDVKLNRQLLRRRFERVEPFQSAQWEIQEAVNGENALELMNKFHFNFVTMDENMSLTSGVLTGTQTVKEYRSCERRRKVAGKQQSVIIAVSGNVAVRDRTRYLEAGMDAVWGKPLPSGDHMVTDIMSCIQKRSVDS